MNFLIEIWNALCASLRAWGDVFPRPAYDVDPKTLPMNQDKDPLPPPPYHKESVPSAAIQLAQTAREFIGEDASPRNRAPEELSCAEGVVWIVNFTWKGCLSPDIVGTDQLYLALKRSMRFRPALDPVEGCIVVFPKTATTHGHTGIYVGQDSIASNDSRTGLFQENYTRESMRAYFVGKLGLKGYFFVPVDN